MARTGWPPGAQRVGPAPVSLAAAALAAGVVGAGQRRHAHRRAAAATTAVPACQRRRRRRRRRRRAHVAQNCAGVDPGAGLVEPDLPARGRTRARRGRGAQPTAAAGRSRAGSRRPGRRRRRRPPRRRGSRRPRTEALQHLDRLRPWARSTRSSRRWSAWGSGALVQRSGAPSCSRTKMGSTV